MNRRKLPPIWKDWRVARKRELLAAGFPLGEAERLASEEARARAHIAELLGAEAALGGDFVSFTDANGVRRGYVTGSNDLLADDAARDLADAITKRTLGATVH